LGILVSYKYSDIFSRERRNLFKNELAEEVLAI
jgi:hypothetical protein